MRHGTAFHHQDAAPGVEARWSQVQCCRFRRFTLLPHRRQMLYGGESVALGGRAFDLLCLLVANRHRVVEKDEILAQVWAGRCVEESNIPVQMMRLRRLLGEDCVITVPQRGYQFAAEVQVQYVTASDSHGLVAGGLGSSRPGSASFLHIVPTQLVGRVEDLADAVKLLSKRSSLVITGPVGVGKSALAAAVGQAWSSHGGAVVWLSADVDEDADMALSRLADALQSLPGGAGALAGADARAPDGGGPLLILDGIDRWTSDVCAQVRRRLAEVPGWRVLITCPSRSRSPCNAMLRLDPPSFGQDLATHESRSADDTSGVQAWMMAMLRQRDSRWPVAPGPQLSAAEIRLCTLLDGRPGPLGVVARWAAMVGPEQVHAWLVKEPALLALAVAAPGARSLLEALDASVSMLDGQAGRAYRLLARTDKALTVPQGLRLLQRHGFESAAALKAMADLLDQHLLRRIEQGQAGRPPVLFMAMPERWHAMGRLRPDTGAAAIPIDMATSRRRGLSMP